MTTQFDSWLASDGPVALTIVEALEPVTGEQGVFFPPTFAPPTRDDKPSYVIDENGTCLVDSVGSQANRLEPIFKRSDLAELIQNSQLKLGSARSIYSTLATVPLMLSCASQINGKSWVMLSWNTAIRAIRKSSQRLLRPLLCLEHGILARLGPRCRD